MRIEEPGGERRLHVIRRTGEVVVVNEGAVVKHKLIPPSTGPLRPPKAWEEKT